MFGRVQESKGITDAIAAICELNLRNETTFKLDIFGPIDEEFAEAFSRSIANAGEVSYCGVVSPERSVECLADYDCLLFPTRYFEEGVPGSIIDALSAGLPVIASRWKYYAEILADGETGLSFEFGRPERLSETIESLLLGGRDIGGIRAHCLARARLYDASIVFSRMVARIGD